MSFRFLLFGNLFGVALAILGGAIVYGSATAMLVVAAISLILMFSWILVAYVDDKKEDEADARRIDEYNRLVRELQISNKAEA